MRERSLIAFTLFMLVAVLKPFSLRGQELQPPPPAGLQTASFAGGCIWCMVHPFEVIDGGTFQISEAFQERYGYPKMTPELRARIFGLNAFPDIRAEEPAGVSGQFESSGGSPVSACPV